MTGRELGGFFSAAHQAGAGFSPKMEVQNNAHTLHKAGCTAKSASAQKSSPWLVLADQGLFAEVRTFLDF